jgi:hypothetical protein
VFDKTSVAQKSLCGIAATRGKEEAFVSGRKGIEQDGKIFKRIGP